MYRRILALLVISIALATVHLHAQEDGAAALPLGKKLIEYGWDVPFPDFVRDHIREMEQRPFDGLIFKLRGGGKVLTPTAWDPAQFEQDYETVQQIAWDRFTHNFVIMWAASEQDWFDDAQWEAIENNVRLMAKAARLAKCVGVCFYAEPYGANPWVYGKAAHHDTKTFAEYQAMVRQRGAQFIRAVEQELPNPHILTFFQLSYFSRLCVPMPPEERAGKLSHLSYGLLPAFLNGMLDGAGPGVRIIDGNESAYYYTEKEQYIEEYHLVRQRARYMIDPALWDKYRVQVDVGQALYIDQYFGLRTHNVLGHYMTPEDRPKWFEHNVYWALYSADSYVWCYSERMNWWKDEAVPPGCEEALRSARDKLASGKPLGLDVASVIAEARQREKDALAHNLKEVTSEIIRLAADAPQPTIDGKLDDPAWEKVGPLDPFAPVASMPDSLEAATHARVACGQQGLFIAFRCDEPDPAKMQIVGENRDDYVFGGEVVEIFIAPGGKSPWCYQFAVNPNGVFWDAAHGELMDTGYNPAWTCAAFIGAAFWSVEAAIPWAALGMSYPEPGAQIHANLCRERNRALELTAWSPPIRLFLEPEHFGTWVFK